MPARNVVAVPEGADALQLPCWRSTRRPRTACSPLRPLKPGEWIGQNLGNSAVGQIVVALARLAGVRTLSVVRREEAASNCGTSAPTSSSSTATTSASGSPKLSAARSLRLVSTARAERTPRPSPGTGVRRHRRQLLLHHRRVLPLSLGDLIYREITLRGFWLINWIRNAPRAEIEKTYSELADLVARGVLTVPVEATYALEQYREAFAHARPPGRAGKVLFTFADAT